MKTFLVSTLTLAAGLAALALPASADDHRGSRDTWRGGDHDGRRGGVILYADPGFSGAARQFNGAVPRFGPIGFNDRVSSIEVLSGAWEVCVDGSYRGRCEIIDSSIRHLRTIGLNDNISFIRPVSYGRGRDRHDDRWRDRPGDRKRDWRGHRGGAGLVLFPDPGQRGRPVEIDQDIPALGPYRFSDKASSFIVNAGTWQVCEHANYRGRCTILTVGAGDLRPIGMNDNISSIRRYGRWR